MADKDEEAQSGKRDSKNEDMLNEDNGRIKEDNEEEEGKEEPELPPNVKEMPLEQYLDDFEMESLLMEGCQILAQERPDDPVEHLAQFLFENDPIRVLAREVAEELLKKYNKIVEDGVLKDD
ncbi:hypothetical protein M758_5G194400 [Ceratodon purpureus]|uniref:Uncharacterized protein n=1 Tax=Ceratodon purpureus TaxID=3225 RepID=A0A8T0I3K0_CERPU|nr:hypothetical protein KC19_5G201700 [Ceratodon purpureus]KAG0617506.1 hypothetical protein M758_5G194400 [Ceratodon purpureus]